MGGNTNTIIDQIEIRSPKAENQRPEEVGRTELRQLEGRQAIKGGGCVFN